MFKMKFPCRKNPIMNENFYTGVRSIKSQGICTGIRNEKLDLYPRSSPQNAGSLLYFDKF